MICVIVSVSIDGSRIGVAGVRKFVGKDWPALREIHFGKFLCYLGKNNIEDRGFEILLN